jgi:DNA-binding MarR family transcriptional regulator
MYMTAAVPPDMLAEMGYLCLGSRLKRMAERLQADAALILKNAGFVVQPSQFNVLAVLDRHGPLSVSQIVSALGLSQPAITRSLAGLSNLGLVETRSQATDGRLKLMGLTRQGAKTFDSARVAIWPGLEKAVREMCVPLSGTLLDQLGQLESTMDAKPLIERFKRGGK